MRRVLIAVDGSNHVRRALSTAAELAAALDDTLIVVTVDEPGPLKGEVAEFARAEDLSRQEVVERIVRSASEVARAAGVKKIETDSASGDPVDGILAMAEKHKADVIVLGARGLSNLQGLVLGSVSHKVMHLTTLPCLIVRQ